MNEFDYDVLRILGGTDVDGWRWGAGMSVCCSFLKKTGLAQGLYEISPKGRELLDLVNQVSPTE